MKYTILFIIFLISLNSCFGQPKFDYKLNKTKAIGFGLCAVGGLFDGVLEGYQFDGRGSFERKWGVKKVSYFGSESWRMAYNNNEPSQGFKSPLHRTAGSFDFYHHADDIRKIGYISGGVIVGIGGRQNKKVWHYLLDFGISFAASAAAKSAGMYWIRN